MPLGVDSVAGVMAVQTKISDILLSDSLGSVNSRQEGKLTDRPGDRNGNAKGTSRLRVFLAIHDQYVFLPGGNLVW